MFINKESVALLLELVFGDSLSKTMCLLASNYINLLHYIRIKLAQEKNTEMTRD